MSLNSFQRLSLKTRVALFTLAIFLISIWSLAFYASRILREDMQKQLGENLFSTATFTAAQINEELDNRFRALGTIAAQVTPAMLGNTVTLRRFLEQKALLTVLFNGGAVAIGRDGIAIANVPMSTASTSINYMDDESISAALKEGKPTISRPTMGKPLHAPVFNMTVPIRDPQGKVIGALAGVVNLGQPNFLDKITEGRYGKTGAYLLNAPQHGLIVTASDKSRIMQPLPAPGVNKMLDRYIHGFEGYGFAVDSRGVEMLNSAKGIPVAGWFIAVVLPTEEAFAPIRETFRHVAVSTVFLTVLVSGLIGWLTWWMLRRQLSPMTAATEALDTHSGKDSVPPPLSVTNQDEIGALIGSFNRLLEALRSRDEELSAREERFRNLIEWAPEPLAVHRGGKVLYANAAAIKLLGAKSAQDLTSKLFLDLIHPDFRHVALARAREIIESRTPMPMIEEQLLKLDGTAIPVEVQSTVIDYDGEAAILVSMHDISERKRAAALRSAKQRAEQAKAVAEEATQAKDHFLAVLSHELRSPLTPVLAAVQLMQRKPNLSGDMRQPLEIIHRNVKLQARLIDDLLDVTRIVRGKLDLERKPLDIATVIKRAVEISKPDIDARKLHFGIEMDGGPFWVNADAVRLQQVVWNLLSNAVKFTPEGGRVGIRCYRRDKHFIIIEVVDSGVGMEPEALNRIFDAFEQGGPAVTRRFGGLGLGLAIARRLVEMHDGTISAHSEGRNKGSALQISLPLVSAEAQTEAAPQAPIATEPSRRILLVEDNEDTVATMKMLLECFGYQVTTAGDVEHALEATASQDFDLLITDLGLPDQSGFELLKELRRRGHTIKGIALSGHGQEEDVRLCREAGFSAHLTKPADADTLVRVIAGILDA